MTDMLKYPEGWMNQLPFTFIMDNPMTRAQLPGRTVKTRALLWCYRNIDGCEVVLTFDGFAALYVTTNTYYTAIFGAN